MVRYSRWISQLESDHLWHSTPLALISDRLQNWQRDQWLFPVLRMVASSNFFPSSSFSTNSHAFLSAKSLLFSYGRLLSSEDQSSSVYSLPVSPYIPIETAPRELVSTTRYGLTVPESAHALAPYSTAGRSWAGPNYRTRRSPRFAGVKHLRTIFTLTIFIHQW